MIEKWSALEHLSFAAATGVRVPDGWMIKIFELLLVGGVAVAGTTYVVQEKVANLADAGNAREARILKMIEDHERTIEAKAALREKALDTIIADIRATDANTAAKVDQHVASTAAVLHDISIKLAEHDTREQVYRDLEKDKHELNGRLKGKK